MSTGSGYRSGFVGIVGRPNVGKSTFVNYLARQKIAITSEKPQTTRNSIRCIITREDAQLIIVDTPGFHKPKDALGEKLNLAVRSTLRDVDLILFMLNASQTIGKGDVFIAGELEKIKTPTAGVLNKVDLLNPERSEAQLEVVKHLYDFDLVLPLSSVTGEGMETLLDALVTFLPQGPQYYPPDVVTDQPENVIVAELIREKALELTREEVPYAVGVMVEEISPRQGSDLVDVPAVIYVEKESQKGIIIGKGGRVIKEIGTRARKEIEPLLGSKVFLDLRVKVKKNWTKDPAFIKRLGYG